MNCEPDRKALDEATTNVIAAMGDSLDEDTMLGLLVGETAKLADATAYCASMTYGWAQGVRTDRQDFVRNMSCFLPNKAAIWGAANQRFEEGE